MSGMRDGRLPAGVDSIIPVRGAPPAFDAALAGGPGIAPLPPSQGYRFGAEAPPPTPAAAGLGYLDRLKASLAAHPPATATGAAGGGPDYQAGAYMGPTASVADRLGPPSAAFPFGMPPQAAAALARRNVYNRLIGGR